MEVRGKRIVIFGLARSGIGAAHLLSSLGAEVTVTDRKPEHELGAYIRECPPSVRLHLGGHPQSLDGTDLVVVSPGVPLTIDPLRKAKERGIPVIGELELAYRMIKDRDAAVGIGETEFLAITGTNGKSTTTTLVDMMLKEAGIRTLLGGNIGNALTGEIFKGPGGPAVDFIVAEVSSFQLESVEAFKPKGAAILNITPDHQDRYASLEAYAEAKARVFLNQDNGDFLILNADDPAVMDHVRAKRHGRKDFPTLAYFSREREVAGLYLRDGTIFCNFPGSTVDITPHAPLIAAGQIAIKGVHNLENAMAASAMALLAGSTADAVTNVLRDFRGLEHRMEFVRELEGVRYINDSKGTNVGAVMKSIEGFREPIVLIAGGRDKAGDFTPLRDPVAKRVKTLVLIGEAAGKMKEALGDVTKTVVASDLTDAVHRARANATGGAVVLLSPACASFDMFRDFEDRGRQFKKIVMELS